MTLPALVILSGPPASGKTTLAGPLARDLGMPLLAKDRMKERMADALGAATLGLSRQIGVAAILILYDTARAILESGQSVVVESFFHHGKSEQDLEPLVSVSRAILIHCTADRDVLLRRYADRITAPDRHAIHGDVHRADELRAYLENGTTDPLDLPVPRLTIDTTRTFPDPADIASRIRNMLDGHM